jgi:hypothetical protein
VFAQHLPVRQAAGKTLHVSSSNGQSFLEGAEYLVNGKWLEGHITISPGETLRGKKGEDSLYFDSVHLTLPALEGNFFFEIDGTTVRPAMPKGKFKGRASKSGNELPPDLKEAVMRIIKNLAGV